MSRTVGGSSSSRMWVVWSSSSSGTVLTLYPLLGRGSTMPSRTRSSIASRTGVAETPNIVPSVGAEYTAPGFISPEMTAARSASATISRSRSRFVSG